MSIKIVVSNKRQDASGWSPHREVNPETANIANWSSRKIIRYRVGEVRRIAEAIQKAAPKLEAGAAVVIEKLLGGGRVITIGAGGSGVAGMSVMREIPQNHEDASPSRFLYVVAGGARILEPLGCEELEDSSEEGAGDVDSLRVTSRDVVICISATGRTPYTRAVAKRARDRGAYTIGLITTPHSELGSEVDHSITLDIGPETFIGATCEKAASAQKDALDALMDVVVVRLGFTNGNLCHARPVHEKARIRGKFFARDGTG
ncbi:SIS domain-containing protein [Candidatus Kaiserbacteria bacterium]|nr:SIS domain-containing protein [Candidatus Kaiserbacteria bacterium]